MKNIYYFFALIPCLLNAQWVQVGNDIFGNPGDGSGPILSVMNSQGNRVAVANAFGSAVEPNAGYVRVFDLITDQWIQVGPDLQGNVYPGEAFGYSVAINASGEYIAVGIRGSGVGSGKAGVYEYNGVDWVSKGSIINGESTGDDFGTATALSADGQTLAISAPGDDGNGTSAGQVRIYQFANGNWIQVGQDINGIEGNEIGNALSLNFNGDIIAIGANGATTTNGYYTGKVMVYENQNDTWVKLGDNIIGNNGGDNMGYSVDLNASGNRLITGIVGTDDVGNDNKGSVKIFEYNGNNWNLLGEEILGKIRLNGFGYSVGINDAGNNIIVGAPTSDPNNPYEGEAWFYKFEGGQWLQYGTSLIGSEINDALGVSVCISSSGDYIVVASGGSDVNPGDNVGKVSVYNTESLLLDVESIDLLNNVISLYPNPANKNLFLQSSSELITEIIIFSQLGSILQRLQWKNGKQNVTLDLEQLATGSYFIKVTTKTNSVVKHIVKH